MRVVGVLSLYVTWDGVDSGVTGTAGTRYSAAEVFSGNRLGSPTI